MIFIFFILLQFHSQLLFQIPNRTINPKTNINQSMQKSQQLARAINTNQRHYNEFLSKAKINEMNEFV